PRCAARSFLLAFRGPLIGRLLTLGRRGDPTRRRTFADTTTGPLVRTLEKADHLVQFGVVHPEILEATIVLERAIRIAGVVLEFAARPQGELVAGVEVHHLPPNAHRAALVSEIRLHLGEYDPGAQVIRMPPETLLEDLAGLLQLAGASIGLGEVDEESPLRVLVVLLLQAGDLVSAAIGHGG